MKKTISLFLALCLLFSGAALIPHRIAHAEDLPAEQVIAESFQKLYDLDSYHYDIGLSMNMNISIVFAGQSVALPMNLALVIGIDQQRDPLLIKGQMDMTMTSMGRTQQQSALFYSQQSGSTLTSYTSADNGANWSASRMELESSPAESVALIINNAKDFNKTGTEKVNGLDADVYVGKLDGKYIQDIMNAMGSNNSMSSMFGSDINTEDLSNMGDIEIAVYIDPQTNLPLRFTMNIADLLKNLMGTALTALMGMEEIDGMEMNVDIPFAEGDCYFSQFNSVPPIEIPEAAIAAAADLPALKAELTMGTGSEAGSYFAVGSVLANVLNDKNPEIMNVKAVSSAGSADNLHNMAKGVYQLAIVQSDTAAYAFYGIHDFESDRQMPNIRILAGLYAQPVQIVTTDPNIKTVADLKGKTVCVGDQNSGTYFNAKDVFDAYGMDIEKDIQPIFQHSGAYAESLKEGKIDAAFLTAGAPTTSVVDLGTAKSVYLVSIDDEHMAKLLEACPFYAKYTISKDVYKTPEDCQTVSVNAILVADASVSDDVAYAIVKTIFENKDGIAAAHAKGAELDLAFAAQVTAIPFHPGAARYYAENGIVLNAGE